MSSTPCEECENRGYILLDTNFLLLLLNYLHIQNPRMRIRDYCSRLSKVLLALSGCSINRKLYVSKRLFDNEIDYFNNNRAALFRESQKFNRGYRDIRSDIRRVLGAITSFLSIIIVDNNDLNLIQNEANSCFGRNPPGLNDLSLILLALNLSNNDSDGHIALIISGDMKLRIFQEKYFSKLDFFETHQGNTLDCDLVNMENRFDPLARVYSCCKLDTIDGYFNLYSEDVKKMLRDNIRSPESFDRKYDILKEVAINKNSFDLIKERNLEEGVCVE